MTRRDRWMLALLLVLAAFAAQRSIARAWTCDDAFITYRYADNFAHGHGLVFNVGERVEGYTNFLLTVMLAAGIRLGIEPRGASIAIGIVSYFAVAALLARWSYRRRSAPAHWVPIGASLWLLQDDLHTWASGGLETTMFAALAAGAFYVLFALEEPRRVLGGALLALTCLSRPDGVLFALVGVAGVALSPRGRSRWKDVALVAAPLVLVGVPYAVFKLQYYGSLLPTTFYAKSAADARYEQGLVYIGLYFAKHWSMTLATVALPIAAYVMGRRDDARIRRDAWIALAAFVVFSAYVAHSAGDYMFARRLVPALPFLFVFLDAAADRVTGAIAPRGLEIASAIILGGALVPYPVMPDEPGVRVHGIADERLFYPEDVVELRRMQGKLAADAFSRHPVRAAFGGGMCMFAYYSGLPDLVEPNGLTQMWIAKEGEPVLGLVGHKGVSREQLREHGVRLVFHNDRPPIAPAELRFDDLIVADALHVEILFYDEALMDALAADRRVRFRPIGAVLAEAEKDVAEMTCEDARATHASLRAFYLSAHPDADARFAEGVKRACTKR